jgi:hypothetical protein
VSVDERLAGYVQPVEALNGLSSDDPYSEGMEAVIKEFGRGSRDKKTRYVFLIPKFSNERMPGKVMGYMPYQLQYGFVEYKDGTSVRALVRTIAHELGHGAFGLKHTNTPEYDISDNRQITSALNLMGYNDSTHLAKFQWDIIHERSGETEFESAEEVEISVPCFGWFDDCVNVLAILDTIKKAYANDTIVKIKKQSAPDLQTITAHMVRVGKVDYDKIRIIYSADSSGFNLLAPSLYSKYNMQHFRSDGSVDWQKGIVYYKDGKELLKILVDDKEDKIDSLISYLFEPKKDSKFEIQLFNGSRRSGRDSVMLITDAPAMPDIRVKIAGNSNSAKKVELRLVISYQRDGETINGGVIKDVRNDVSIYPSPSDWQSVKMNEEWDVDFNQDIRGGTAYLLCRDGSKVDTIRFYIRGKNPTEAQIRNYLTQQNYYPQYWFIIKITRQESSLRQFETGTNYRKDRLTGVTNASGEPLYGRPRGFGLKQLDNWGVPTQYATPQHLWHWEANIDGGVEVIREKEDEVERIRENQNNIINQWNQKNLDDTVSDSLEIIAGDGIGTKILTITEGQETFAVTPTSNQRQIYDAMWIKRFNGGNNYHQILMPNDVPEEKRKPYRAINRIGNGQNYVEAVCNLND